MKGTLMKARVAPVTEQKESINSVNVRQQKQNRSLTSNFVDNRRQTTALSQLQQIANNHIQNKASFQPSNTPIQKKENKTGLPDNLKSGMENLSGMSLEHVNVHYNSSKPAAVQAHAYAQGSDIHLASGQEKHLPHELGHVVQQAQGRVQPTTSVSGMAVNDNVGLESEATIMGNKAQQKVQQGI